ncbi:MAG: hypothetical protein KA369_01280 [Spirochaetes bacterium]|nr:hypothetical protein [Spirochaetota bacterium]
MDTGKGKLYMKLGGFKKISGQSQSKARTMSILSKIALPFISGRVIIACVLILIAAFWANDNIRKKGVPPKCWFSMTGDTAVTKGVITNIEFIALGPKNNNDYKILYAYSAGGKTYKGESYQTGLIYRKNEAIDVTYSVKDPSCSCGVAKCPIEDAMFTVIFGGLFALIALLLFQSGIRRMFKAIWIIEHGLTATATVKHVTRSSKIVWTMKYARTVTKWIVSYEFKDASGNNVKGTVIAPTEDCVGKGDSIAVIYDPAMAENAIAIDALPFFVKTNPPWRQ